MTVPVTPVSIGDFQIGELLPGDIVDENEKVLFRHGLRLTTDIVSAWQRRGEGPFFLRGDVNEVRQVEPVETLATSDSGPATQIQSRVDAWMELTVVQLKTLVLKVLNDQHPTLYEIEACLENHLDLLKNDAAVIAHCVVLSDREPIQCDSAERRSVYLAALSGVIAQSYGLSRDECATTCLAALLHDLALYPGILEKIQDSFDSEEERASVVTRHGYFSSDLLSARTGVSELVRIIMQQVHEQMDGCGYPRGIPGHVINIMARMINLADAFLTLIAAGGSSPAFVPADAIAYLVYHTSRGAFDREAMLAFIQVQTMYGIGSRVLLDDGREAIVVASAICNPLRPVVQIVPSDGGIPVGVVELMQTELNIVHPLVDTRFAHRIRMPKSKMQNILWQMVDR